MFKKKQTKNTFPHHVFTLSLKKILFLKKYFTHSFLEKGEGRERGKHQHVLPLVYIYAQLKTWPPTQAGALTGN